MNRRNPSGTKEQEVKMEEKYFEEKTSNVSKDSKDRARRMFAVRKTFQKDQIEDLICRLAIR